MTVLMEVEEVLMVEQMVLPKGEVVVAGREEQDLKMLAEAEELRVEQGMTKSVEAEVEAQALMEDHLSSLSVLMEEAVVELVAFLRPGSRSMRALRPVWAVPS